MHQAPIAPSACAAAIPALLLLAITLPAVAEWPQFRGPEARGIDDGQPLPTTWSVTTGEAIRWQTPIPGLAHSSPVVWGDRVYLTTAIKPGIAELKVGLYGDIDPVSEKESHQWRLLALDRMSGKVVWDAAGPEAVPSSPRHPKATQCNSTPATDGQRIVAIFGSEGLFCFDNAGKQLWKNDLGPMKAGFFRMPSALWGFASSPVIQDGKVIVLCDVLTNSFLAAFDCKDGKELWRTPRQDVPTWGTPTVVEAAGRKQIVVNGWHHTGGYEFASGKELWKLAGGGDIPVPTPIFAEGLVFLTSAHGTFRPIRAIRPDARGDITPAKPEGTNGAIAWVHPRRGNYMQTPIAVAGLLWACFDNGTLTCFDAKSGVVQYSEKLGPGSQGFTASPVSDGRHLYFTSELGDFFVVPAKNQFSVVATNAMGESCMATPAITDGTLLIRTRSKLVAVGAAAR